MSILRRVLRTPHLRYLLIELAAYTVTLVGLGGAAVAGWGTLFLAFLLLSAAVELLIARPTDLATLLFARLHLDMPFRTILRTALATLLVALSPVREEHHLEAALVVILVSAGLLQVARLTVEQLTRWTNRAAAPPIEWANLAVTGVHRPLAVRHALSEQTLGTAITVVDVPLCIGAALVAGGHPGWLLPAWALVSVLAAAAAVGVAALRAREAHANPADLLVRDRVRAALEELAPRSLIYFSRPENTGYILTVWLPTLAALDEPVLIVLRERQHLELAAQSGLPTVLVVQPGDLEEVVPTTVRVALYPSNVAKNNHLIRIPGIKDVFIGHGDSDKGGSATTLSRIYDEVWVSGPAGRERYQRGDVGVRDEQIVEIGRPQLAAVRRQPSVVETAARENLGTAAAARWTVLYAPTREGFYADWNYSSVLSLGEPIVRTLLGLDDVRLILKTHPGTGTDDPAFAQAALDLAALVTEAGAPHRVATSEEELFDVFNDSDMLVSDISSVISDFLASGKPYVVTNPSGLDAETFRRTFPSAGGAAILGPDISELAAMVEDARHEDVFAARRAEVAAYLLGTSSQDPVARFAEALDRLAAQQDVENAALAAGQAAGPASVAVVDVAEDSRRATQI